MEFFLPSLCLFLLAIIITFLIAPRVTPLIAGLLSIIFLLFGVYEHQRLFASEYRLSTWQDYLKNYAPAIMIGSIILYIIYVILSFFTGGAVPVPSVPNLNMPNDNTLTNTVVESLNKVVNSLTNKKNNVVKSINNTIDKVNQNRTNLLGSITSTNKSENTKEYKNNLSRSFLETL